MWNAHPIYRESHRHLEIEDHLALILGMECGSVHGIAVGRLTGQVGAT